MINLLSDPEYSAERKVLAEFAVSCGATAGTIIRMDRSGRNDREAEGLLFEQLAKWILPNANNNREWLKRRGDEFYGKDKMWGVTGEALLSGRIVDVCEIRKTSSSTHWYGDCLDFDGAERSTVQIKSNYCEVMEDLLGSPLKDMLVAPIQCNNIVVGAIKLFNHDHCKRCMPAQKGFEAHRSEAIEIADRIALEWLSTHPIRCEVATVFIDVADSTSFLIASGYYDGARVFQVFTKAIQEEIIKIAAEVRHRSPTSRAALIGGIPFLDKFTGDGVLVVFPYDKIPLFDGEHIESNHVGPYVKRIVEAADARWQSILESVDCRRVLREAAMSSETLRVAISSGPAYIGTFGIHLSAIGRPLIEASRILAHKEIYETAFGEQRGGPRIVVSQQFVEDFKISHAERLEQRWQLRGLPGDRVVYRVQRGYL
jgi:class 3 adenylate cyclase